jgi:hypothetical protein
MRSSKRQVLFNKPDSALRLSGASKSIIGGTVAEGCTSSRKFIDTDGLLKTAAANVPVWENGGLRHEGAATNLLIKSNTLSDWTKNGTPTVTQNVIGPDGELSAWTVVDADTSVEQSIYSTITLDASIAYTYQFDVKKTAGPQETYPIACAYRAGTLRAVLITIDTTNGIVTLFTSLSGFSIYVASAVITSLNASYWRVSFTFTTIESFAHTFKLLPVGTSDPIQSVGPILYVDTGSSVFCNAQLALANPSSYIPTTTAAVTRATCALSVPLVLNQNFFQKSAILMRVRAKWANSTGAKSWLTPSTTAEGIIDNGSGALTFKDSAANTATANLTSWSADTIISVAIVTDNVTGLMSLSASKDNGVTWVDSADTAFAGLTVGADWLLFSGNTQVFECLGWNVLKSNKGFAQMKAYAKANALRLTQ